MNYDKSQPGTKPLMVWNIPEKLKKRFKTVCARRGITMKQAVINLMKQFVRNVKP